MSGKNTAAIAERQSRLLETLDEFGLDAVAVNAGPSLVYLTGLHFHLSERPVLGVFSAAGAHLVLPELESGKAAKAGFDLATFPYNEDPSSWQLAFDKALKAAGATSGKIGVEPTSLRFLELRFIEAATPKAEITSAADCLAELRVRKDAHEIAMMRDAVRMAEEAVEATVNNIRPGATEKEISSELVVQLLRAGSSPTLPFDPIVAAGPNSADPHAVPTTRKLRENEILLIDWGASNDGYFSDLTRLYAFGEPDEQSLQIAEIVAEANAAGRSAAEPGATAASIDRAAREVIEKSGFGKKFTHRTGHGLGLEVHEEPYIRADSDRVLEAGMTFTIEPGIYLAGTAGARIEDDMVITEDGAESLSSISRDLVIL